MWNKLVGLGSFLFTAIALFGTLLIVYFLIALVTDPKADIAWVERPLGAFFFVSYMGANFGLLLIVFAQSVHAARNRWLSQSEIIAWVIALWIIPYLTPIYWYRYMRPSLESEWIDDE